MNTNRIKSIALMIILVLAVAGCARKKAPVDKSPSLIDPNAPPNIIIYLIDALRPDHLSTYGYFRDTSPKIDRFAQDSILFTNAYVQSSWTKPSVATLFTGRYPSSHGAIERDDVLFEQVTLADMLKYKGYHTAAFVTNLNVLPVYGFGKGFDEFFKIDGKYYAPADKLNEELFNYLDRKPKRPLFLYIHSMDPHYPYIPPPSLKFQYTNDLRVTDEKGKTWPVSIEINLYDDEIAFADHHFGKFLEKLKQKKLYDDSLIIFLSDHGEEFREHGGQYHGWTLFQEQIRIPLIIKLPANLRAGTRENRPVRTLDIFPTTCDLLNIEPPGPVDGETLSRILAGKPTPDWNPVLFSEERHDGHELQSWIDGEYKLIVRTKPEKKLSLFNLKKDPRELDNLVDAEPERVQIMKTAIDRFAAGLTSGFHLKISNSKLNDPPHAVRGFIKIAGGTFEEKDVFDAEPGDSIVFDEMGRSCFFQYTLTNRPNPLKTPPEVIRDINSIKFNVSSLKARLQIYIEVNGEKLPGDAVILGPGNRLDKTLPMPFEIDAGDPRLLAAPGTANRPPADDESLTCHLYRIPQKSRKSVQIDKNLKRRLRDLGYFH